MSTFSYTDWTVICDQEGCGRQERTDTLDMRAGSGAADVRKVLKKRGWAVAIRVPDPDPRARVRRLDYCPDHKPQEG